MDLEGNSDLGRERTCTSELEGAETRVQDTGLASSAPSSPIPDPTCTAMLAPFPVCRLASLVLCLVADSFAYVSYVLTHHGCHELDPRGCLFSVCLETAKTCTAVP